jgi:hypothetical protein
MNPVLPGSGSRRGALIVVTVAWLWNASVSHGAEAEWRLHARGLGRLTVGMTLAQARGLPGVRLEQIGPPPVADTYCTYFVGRVAGGEFRVRVKMDRVDRVEVASPGLRTLSGVAVGDAIERVKSTYGRITVEPHHSRWDRGDTLMVLGPYEISGDAYGMAFVASPGRGVTEIWAGRYEGIRESEGCT